MFGPADRDLLAFEAPDLQLFYPSEVSADQAIDYAANAEKAALSADPRITNTEGGSFNSHYGIRVFGNTLGMLQSYCSSRHSMSACVIAEENGDMERDYAYTIARKLDDLKSAQWVGEECARRTLSRLAPRKLATQKAPVILPRKWQPVCSGIWSARSAVPLCTANLPSCSTASVNRSCRTG